MLTALCWFLHVQGDGGISLLSILTSLTSTKQQDSAEASDAAAVIATGEMLQRSADRATDSAQPVPSGPDPAAIKPVASSASPAIDTGSLTGAAAGSRAAAGKRARVPNTRYAGTITADDALGSLQQAAAPASLQQPASKVQRTGSDAAGSLQDRDVYIDFSLPTVKGAAGMERAASLPAQDVWYGDPLRCVWGIV